MNGILHQCFHIGDSRLSDPAFFIFSGAGPLQHPDFHTLTALFVRTGFHISQRKIQRTAAIIDQQQSAVEITPGLLLKIIRKISAGSRRFADDLHTGAAVGIFAYKRKTPAYIPQPGSSIHGRDFIVPDFGNADNQIVDHRFIFPLQYPPENFFKKLLGDALRCVDCVKASGTDALFIIFGKHHFESPETFYTAFPSGRCRHCFCFFTDADLIF